MQQNPARATSPLFQKACHCNGALPYGVTLEYSAQKTGIPLQLCVCFLTEDSMSVLPEPQVKQPHKYLIPPRSGATTTKGYYPRKVRK
ncbi:hypothetical protein FRC20_006614 [Serendipita sp. 405]|nr:hypothetical protein FRC20_006614 [Serendipita sp. 405]